MNTYIFRLVFPYGVRFGADTPGIGLEKASYTCHSDTVFSALCCEASKAGEEKLKAFLETAKSGELLISGLMPYKEDSHYIPKIAFKASGTDEATEDIAFRKKARNAAKLMKKMTHFPLYDLDVILDYYRGKFVDKLDDIIISQLSIETKVSLAKGVPEPYFVGSYYIRDDCGLYFIAKASDRGYRILEELLDSLSYSGLGGKVSAGYGRFEIADKVCLKQEGNKYDLDILYGLLNDETAPYQVSLSTLIPSENEVDDAIDSAIGYTLVRRAGFANISENTPHKKKTVIMFGQGSCFSTRIKGTIVDVPPADGIPALRYGKGFFLGVRM